MTTGTGSSAVTLGEWLAVIPGVAGMLGAAGVFGALRARVSVLEGQVKDLRDIKAEVATIAERTRNMSDAAERQADDLSRITGHLLNEARSFASDIVRRERRTSER